jgi:hypothetical protein
MTDIKLYLQMPKIILALICSFFSLSLLAQTITGKVIDEKSAEPLAFVNIVIAGTNTGTNTDIDGKFSISGVNQDEALVFSYVGYKQRTIPVKELERTIKLQSAVFELKEIDITAGENPAHRIIDLAIKNRKKHNPNNLNSYSYQSYNKLVFGSDLDDNTYFNYQNDPESVDTSTRTLIELMEKQHLFMSESVSKKVYKKPDQYNETVLASRTSGIKNIAFTTLASEFQSFSFYTDNVSLLGADYVSPISPGSTSRYFFSLEDTLYSGVDTTFILSYKPKKGTTFNGLKGLLYISTQGYALSNVIAEPAISDSVFSLQIQQQYQLVDGKQWFPKQLNTNLTIYVISANGFGVKGVGRSYIDSIKINPELKRKDIGPLGVNFDENALDAEKVLEAARVDTLSAKENETYRVIDSIGEAENLDQIVSTIQTISEGYIPIKWFNLDLAKIIAINEFEGLRLGFGGTTNDLLSKYFSLGGYYAYGFKDLDTKYGGNLTLKINQKKDVSLGIIYKNDVFESGRSQISNFKPLTSESIRSYFIRDMFNQEGYEGRLQFRALKDLLFTMSYRDVQHTILVDTGSFPDFLTGSTNKSYNDVSAGIEVKFAFREKFIRLPYAKTSLGTRYPIIWYSFRQGLSDYGIGELNYIKQSIRIRDDFKIRRLGTTYLGLEAGLIEGNASYLLLDGSPANKHSGLNINSRYSMETIGLNSVLSNRYLYLFFEQNTGVLIKKGFFQPSLGLVANYAIGNLSDSYQSLKATYSTLEGGYLENGIKLDGIFVSQILTLKTSYGVGVYQKTYPYISFNPLFKLSLNIGF